MRRLDSKNLSSTREASEALNNIDHWNSSRSPDAQRRSGEPVRPVHNELHRHHQNH